MRHAIILAGGSGTRLWPLSRETVPKQLIPLIGGKSLLELAFERLEGLVEPQNRLVCTGEKHRNVILERIPCIGPDMILGEPEGRDTLAALAYGCAMIKKRDPEAVVTVVTADHLIRPVETFRRLVEEGFELAETHPSVLVTFGVKPDHAATGFGYLELGRPFSSDDGTAMRVERFIEKPDQATADGFFRAGAMRYLWNSGMFVWKATRFLELVGEFEPDVHAAAERIAQASGTAEYRKILTETFPKIRKVSVDYAVMEPASRQGAVVAIPLDLEWLDIGSWPAYAETCAKDERNNAVAAPETVLIESCGNLVVSEDGHLVSLLGCENLIVVHTKDATLVCHRDKAQDIKKAHAEVKARFGTSFID